jgi:glycosyltransferase involved in cell wall biosynthesis
VLQTDRPLRILHLTAHTEAGGLSRYIHDLALAMHHQGHDIRVAGNRGQWHRLFENASFPFIELPLDKGPIKLWQAARALRHYLKEFPADIIHSHYRRTTFVARRLQKNHNPPILYTLHLSDIPLGWRARLLGDFGDHTHVASAQAKDWCINSAKVAAEKISLLPHGIHLEKFPAATPQDKAAARAQFNLGATDRVAVYVGRLDTPKNESWLLDVADQSRQSIPNLKILIAGTGPHEAAFKNEIQTRNLPTRVILLGEQENPLPVYQAADAMLLPSQREGFSLATAEAMSVGVPVCRTATAGSAELILDKINGRITPIDREAFVTAAIEFLSDESSRRKMSQNAPARIREHFSFERQLREMTELYYHLATCGIAPSDRS